MGSCDTGIEDWSFLGVTGYEAMVEFTEVHQSCFPASVLNLKRWPDLCHLQISLMLDVLWYLCCVHHDHRLCTDFTAQTLGS